MAAGRRLEATSGRVAIMLARAAGPARALSATRAVEDGPRGARAPKHHNRTETNLAWRRAHRPRSRRIVGILKVTESLP